MPDVFLNEETENGTNNTVESLNRIIGVQVEVREKEMMIQFTLRQRSQVSDIQRFADSKGEVAETGDLFSYFHLGEAGA